MNVEEFRKKIKIDLRIVVDNQIFKIEQLVKFRYDDGSFYIKCYLQNGFVLADDLNDNIFVFVKEIQSDIQLPFSENLEFDGKKFEFLFEAHAVAEEIWGKELFKKSEGEKFWDYKSEDESYLSLGIHDETGKRQDFYGKIIKDVEFL